MHKYINNLCTLCLYAQKGGYMKYLILLLLVSCVEKRSSHEDRFHKICIYGKQYIGNSWHDKALAIILSDNGEPIKCGEKNGTRI